jgi:hypothetical protein
MIKPAANQPTPLLRLPGDLTLPQPLHGYLLGLGFLKPRGEDGVDKVYTVTAYFTCETKVSTDGLSVAVFAKEASEYILPFRPQL